MKSYGDIMVDRPVDQSHLECNKISLASHLKCNALHFSLTQIIENTQCASLGFKPKSTVQAAIALAAIYQRSDQINSAGGYLRSLTDKAREGKFSTWPMIMALVRAKLDESKRRQSEAEANAGGAPRLEFSDSLVKSLQKLKPLP